MEYYWSEKRSDEKCERFKGVKKKYPGIRLQEFKSTLYGERTTSVRF